MRKLTPVLLAFAVAGCGGSAKLTESQEYFMARGVGALSIERDHLWTDEKVEEYVTLVGLTIAFESDRPETYKGYHFAVLNTDQVNAFAAPSGFIFVTKGALRAMESEDELAGVLAHEIAHVNLRHPELAADRSAKETGLMDFATALSGAAGIGSMAAGLFGKKEAANYLQTAKDAAPAFGKSLASLQNSFSKGYGREEEFAADKLAVDFLTRKGVGYDPSAFKTFIGRLPKKEDAYGSHPGLDGRVKEIEDEITKHKYAPADAARTKRFLAMKAGLGT
ncbi:MAG: M48 family metalloprotease [Planctomycetes bacterium]|nr:M48 family metalloprotease [Planctomycetota bacterium]